MSAALIAVERKTFAPVLTFAVAFSLFSATVAFAGERIASTDRLPGVSMDTRRFDSTRTVSSVGEVLPLAYDTAWGTGAAVSGTLTLTPLAYGEPKTARQVVFPVTSGAGTVVWTPSYREVYRAEFHTADGSAWTVDLDCTGAKDIVTVLGVVQPNGDVFFESLYDVSGEAMSLTLPSWWLTAVNVDRDLACDATRTGANGIPVWQSYLQGLDPNVALAVPEFAQYRPDDLLASFGSVEFKGNFASASDWKLANSNSRLSILLGTDTPYGNDVLYVGGLTNDCDTAWRCSLVKSRKLSRRAAAYVYAVDMRSSMDVFSQAKPTGSWGFSVSWYGSNGQMLSTDVLTPKSCASNDWQRIWRMGYVPEGAVSYSVQLGCDNPNIGQGHFMAFRNLVFGLTDATWAVSDDIRPPRVKLLTSSPTQDEHAALRVSVSDESIVCAETVRIAVDGQDETAAFSRQGDVWSLSGTRTWTKGIHTVDVAAADWYGNVRNARRLFFIGEAPSAGKVEIRSDGTILTDGEPFFPLGVYSVGRRAFNGYDWDKAFSGLKAAGINVVQSHSAKGVSAEFLDAASRYGMRTLLTYKTGDVNAAMLPGDDFAGRLRQLPATLAWYLGDDTSEHQSPEALEDCDAAAKAIDPNHVSAQADGLHVSASGDHYRNYVNGTDVFIPELYHIYPDAVPDADCVANVIRDMKRCWENIARYGDGRPKAVVPVIQNFGNATWRMPNPDEETATTFAAIVHGANGIMWYSYGSSNGMTTTPERWGAFSELATRLADLSPVILDETVSVPEPTVLSGPSTDSLGQPSVSVLVKRHDGAVYAIAVNACYENVRARLSLPGSADAATVLWEDRQLNVKSGMLTDDFAPFAVHVYRLGGAAARFSSVSPAVVGSDALRSVETVPQELNALLSETGGVEGVCCSAERVYLAHAKGIEVLDWSGRFVRRTDVPEGLRDLAYADGQIYGAFTLVGAETGGNPGLIRVWDESFNLIRERYFSEGLTGIAVVGGSVYAGVDVPGRAVSQTIRVKKLIKSDLTDVADVTIPIGFAAEGGIRAMTTDGTNVFCLAYGASADGTICRCNYVIELTPQLGFVRASYTDGETECVDLVPSSLTTGRSSLYLSVEALNGNSSAWLADPANCPPQVRLNFSTSPVPQGAVSCGNLTAALDTRSFGALRAVPVHELLPFAYSNDRLWAPGGLPAAQPATVVVTPGHPVVEGDGLSFVPTGSPETLVSASGEGVVSGWVPTGSCYRVTLEADGEIRGSAVFLFGSVAVDGNSRTVALDTRRTVPYRTLSADELLPFAYDASWWPDATAIASLTVTPLTNDVPEEARQDAVPVKGGAGTCSWTPTYREVYRAAIRAEVGDPWTVDLDLTGVTNLAVMGVGQANGDIVFTHLRDASGREATLTVPDSWLRGGGLSVQSDEDGGDDRTLARDTMRSGANGIPVWQSYVLGLDPDDETSLPRAVLVPTDRGTFRVEAEGLDDMKTDLIRPTYRLYSTDALGKAFKPEGDEQEELPEVTPNGAHRFYRIGVKVHWCQ